MIDKIKKFKKKRNSANNKTQKNTNSNDSYKNDYNDAVDFMENIIKKKSRKKKKKKKKDKQHKQQQQQEQKRTILRRRRLTLATLRHQQQHRTDRVPAIAGARAVQHLLRGLLHPRPPADHEHALVRHQVLEQGPQAGVLPASRGLPRRRRRVPQAPAPELGPEGVV